MASGGLYGLRTRFQQIHQGADMILVMPPAVYRGRVDFLPHLPDACSLDGTIVFMEVVSGIVPVQAAELDELAAHAFLVGNQALVIKLEIPVGGHYLAPVLHEPFVIALVKGEVLEIVGIRMVAAEMLDVDRQAIVHWMPPHMD